MTPNDKRRLAKWKQKSENLGFHLERAQERIAELTEELREADALCLMQASLSRKMKMRLTEQTRIPERVARSRSAAKWATK